MQAVGNYAKKASFKFHRHQIPDTKRSPIVFKNLKVPDLVLLFEFHERCFLVLCPVSQGCRRRELRFPEQTTLRLVEVQFG